MVLIKKYADGLVVRSAEAGDKEAVSDIDAFADLDYVHVMYDHYMENPNYHLFVGEIHGRVVSVIPNIVQSQHHDSLYCFNIYQM